MDITNWGPKPTNVVARWLIMFSATLSGPIRLRLQHATHPTTIASPSPSPYSERLDQPVSCSNPWGQGIGSGRAAAHRSGSTSVCYQRSERRSQQGRRRHQEERCQMHRSHQRSRRRSQRQQSQRWTWIVGTGHGMPNR